jgi:copper chaperone CopZ
MTTLRFNLPNITCSHCVRTIETEVAELPGVQSVKVTLSTKDVEIHFKAPADESKIKALLTEIHYPAAPPLFK